MRNTYELHVCVMCPNLILDKLITLLALPIQYRVSARPISLLYNTAFWEFVFLQLVNSILMCFGFFFPFVIRCFCSPRSLLIPLSLEIVVVVLHGGDNS